MRLWAGLKTMPDTVPTSLFAEIQTIALAIPNDVALLGEVREYTYSELIESVREISGYLDLHKFEVLALYAGNTPEWVILDLACQLSGIALLPIPQFFSEQQIQHSIQQAGACGVIHQSGDRIAMLFPQEEVLLAFEGFILSPLKKGTARLPNGTSKITFTSGSTGDPKGVCLSNQQQLSVAKALQQILPTSLKRHLSVIPFSTLLENLTGVYVCLLNGGTLISSSAKALGFNGSSGFQLSNLLSQIELHQPNSMILLPELLTALVDHIAMGWTLPESVEFIAIGGSKVPVALLEKANQYAVPVYEGYGLSECASVVSLNLPESRQIGSVGKLLPHVSIEIENDEIVISNNAFLGYVNEPDSWYQDYVKTGDLGFIDEAGYLFIDGRKKNLLISSFGRNINPEWVESCLLASRLLQQCIVLGDARPYCIALLTVVQDEVSDQQIQTWITQVNQTLPDYAQLKNWLRIPKPFCVENGLLTSNGRLKREAISDYYQLEVNNLYQENTL